MFNNLYLMPRLNILFKILLIMQRQFFINNWLTGLAIIRNNRALAEYTINPNISGKRGQKVRKQI